jgi:hypothetical protein
MQQDKNLIESRRDLLCDTFQKYGLAPDMKSETCMQYIYLGQNAFYDEPERIARVFCETRFLNEYCDVRLGTRLAKERCVNTRLPRVVWLQKLKMYILNTENYTKFPDTWPWLEDKPPKFHVTPRNYVFFDDMKVIRKSTNRHRKLKSRSSRGDVWASSKTT